MGWKDEISDVIDPQNSSPSLSYWVSILNYFENNRDKLSLADLEYLAVESERCREYWNCKGLDIEKSDVRPNIHRHIEQKILEVSPPEANEFPFEPNLAAMPQ